MEKNCIVLFTRYPEYNNVKKRLSKNIDKKIVVELQRCFILDILKEIKKTSFSHRICYYPSDKGVDFKSWLIEYSFLPQIGNALGERMDNCFKDLFRDGFEKIVLIGSDVPEIDYNIFIESFALLKEKDMVIGPTFDGGYYLIGFNKKSYNSDFFYNINWGTDKVFNDTIQKICSRKISYGILKKISDIDTILDLKDLIIRNNEIENIMLCVKKYGLDKIL